MNSSSRQERFSIKHPFKFKRRDRGDIKRLTSLWFFTKTYDHCCCRDWLLAVKHELPGPATLAPACGFEDTEVLSYQLVNIGCWTLSTVLCSPATPIHSQEQLQPHLPRIQGYRENGTLDLSPGPPSTPPLQAERPSFYPLYRLGTHTRRCWQNVFSTQGDWTPLLRVSPQSLAALQSPASENRDLSAQACLAHEVIREHVCNLRVIPLHPNWQQTQPFRVETPPWSCSK